MWKIFTIILLTSCSSLHLRDDDSGGVQAAKVCARVPVAIISLGFSEAWHYQERKMESWLGHNVKDLLISWGNPNQVVEDDTGGAWLIYREARSYTSPGQSYTQTTGTATAVNNGYQTHITGQAISTTTYTPGQTNHWSVMRRFYATKEGTIIEYFWEGF